MNLHFHDLIRMHGVHHHRAELNKRWVIILVVIICLLISESVAAAHDNSKIKMEDASIICLGLNVYYESRAEPYEGQMAVAQVSVRRAKKTGFENWEDWICPVVYATRQFSWTNGKNTVHPLPGNGKKWEQALSVARMAILWGHLDHIPDYSNQATHYHHKKIRPWWSRKMKKTVKLGNHVFLKEK